MTVKYFYIYLIVVTVNFGQSLYSYNENNGVVSNVTIILSTAIAQSLLTSVSGGIMKLYFIISCLINSTNIFIIIPKNLIMSQQQDHYSDLQVSTVQYTQNIYSKLLI